MRTKASIKGHAIHQMLIPFPIAFLFGAFIFDLLGFFYSGQFHFTGYYLSIAGIISALLAALPGFIDFIYSVPPGSSGKKRGVKHLTVNLSAVLLFFVAFILRADPASVTPLILLLEFAAVILLTMGGWLGGTLVNRNFIGPDHRYADKGKWKEKTFNDYQNIYEAADLNELKLNQMKLIRIKDKRIVLAKTEEGYVSFADSCTHRGGSLAAGVMICNTVHCLWHGSQFNVNTGEATSGPAEDNITTYKTFEQDGKVFISLD
jgi:uncharacterized membrane protein/nitrite reductase/ring-hydroxylating ferredoxin subunit